jgi:hypothetical protein
MPESSSSPNFSCDQQDGPMVQTILVLRVIPSVERKMLSSLSERYFHIRYHPSRFKINKKKLTPFLVVVIQLLQPYFLFDFVDDGIVLIWQTT